jgi:hypothetical protein
MAWIGLVANAPLADAAISPLSQTRKRTKL